MCDHLAVAAVATEHRSVARYVEVYRPFVALQVKPGSFAGRDLVPCDPEVLASRRLQVIPDHLSVVAEKLVAGNLHVHGAGVKLCQPTAVSVHGPKAVHPMPGAFVTEHDEIRVRGRELQVTEP